MLAIARQSALGRLLSTHRLLLHGSTRRVRRPGATPYKVAARGRAIRALHTSSTCRSSSKHDQEGSNITLDLPVFDFVDEDLASAASSKPDDGPSATDAADAADVIDATSPNGVAPAPVEKSTSGKWRSNKSAPPRRPAKVPIPIPVCITGGSGVLALAVAQAFASHPVYPFQITLVGRSADKLSDQLAKLPKSANFKWPHKIIQADITTSECWDPNTSKWSVFPQTDFANVPAVLVNCAGAPDKALLSKASELDLLAAVQLNLSASMFSCRAFASSMFRSMRGVMMKNWPHAHFTPSIINVGSILGQQGGLGAPAYAAAKAGLLGLTRAAAAEYGRMGIRVNAVVPGVVRSEMTSKVFTKKILDEIAKTIPVRRLAEPAEVADAVVFLALNNYANNCVLNIDGGLSAVGPIDRFLRPDLIGIRRDDSIIVRSQEQSQTGSPSTNGAVAGAEPVGNSLAEDKDPDVADMDDSSSIHTVADEMPVDDNSATDTVADDTLADDKDINLPDTNDNDVEDTNSDNKPQTLIPP